MACCELNLLTECGSQTLREDRKTVMLAFIDGDIAVVGNQGWEDPAERRFHLRVLRDKVEAIGTSKVVSLTGHIETRLVEDVRTAMQAAMSGEVTDPSVVQRVVAYFISDLSDGASLDDWGYAAQAVVNVGKAVVAAKRAGLPLERAVEVARPPIGA